MGLENAVFHQGCFVSLWIVIDFSSLICIEGERLVTLFTCLISTQFVKGNVGGLDLGGGTPDVLCLSGSHSCEPGLRR